MAQFVADGGGSAPADNKVDEHALSSEDDLSSDEGGMADSEPREAITFSPAPPQAVTASGNGNGKGKGKAVSIAADAGAANAGNAAAADDDDDEPMPDMIQAEFGFFDPRPRLA